jgi:hypothetical protein
MGVIEMNVGIRRGDKGKATLLLLIFSRIVSQTLSVEFFVAPDAGCGGVDTWRRAARSAANLR